MNQPGSVTAATQPGTATGSGAAQPPSAVPSKRRSLVDPAIIAALITAAIGGGGLVGAVRPLFAGHPTGTLTTMIHIMAPGTNSLIDRRQSITGTVSGLAVGDVVWSYNEPFTKGASPSPEGNVFPDPGPCLITGDTFTCSLDTAGEDAEYCRVFELWVTVLSSAQADKVAKMRAGLTYPGYFRSIDEETGPPSLAVDRVIVRRRPESGAACTT